MANVQCRISEITPGSRVTRVHLRIRTSASGDRTYFFTTSGDPAGLEETKETTGLSIELLEPAELAEAADQRKSSISDGSGFVARREAPASGAGSAAPKRAAEDDMTPEEMKRQNSLKRDAYLPRIKAVPVTFKAQHDPAGEGSIKASAARSASREGLVNKELSGHQCKTLPPSPSTATATQTVQASSHSSKPSDEDKTLGTKNVSKVEVIGLKTPLRASSQGESRLIENATSEDAPENGFTRIGNKVLTSDGIRTYLVQFIDDKRKEIFTTKDMWDMYDGSPHNLSIHGMQLWPGCKDPDAAPKRSPDKFGPAGLIGQQWS
ncbi:hypothetical protein BJ546DRAFT_1061536 [Cryomyces antarcticus]